MQDDPIPFASAPEPFSAQVPTPVTSALPRPEPAASASGRRRTSLVPVAAILALGLLVAGGVWLYLSPTGGAAPASIRASVETSLRSCVATDYPGYTVARAASFSRDDTTSPGGRSASVQFLLQSAAHPGFKFTLVYYAPLMDAADAARYESDEEFFRAHPAQPQPVDSFIVMWLQNHPGEDCFSVLEGMSDSTDDIRTYWVAATRYERNGAVVKTLVENYDFHYAPATDSWTEVPRSPDVTDASGSLVDTEAAVAQSLPGFEYVASESDSLDNPTLVVRSVKYPKVRVVVYQYVLDGGDPNDGVFRLITGDRTKADAFAKAFSKAYAGSVVWDVTFDPEGTDNEDMVDVWMQPSGDTVRLSYNPKAHVWTKVK